MKSVPIAGHVDSRPAVQSSAARRFSVCYPDRLKSFSRFFATLREIFDESPMRAS